MRGKWTTPWASVTIVHGYPEGTWTDDDVVLAVLRERGPGRYWESFAVVTEVTGRGKARKAVAQSLTVGELALSSDDHVEAMTLAELRARNDSLHLADCLTQLEQTARGLARDVEHLRQVVAAGVTPYRPEARL